MAKALVSYGFPWLAGSLFGMTWESGHYGAAMGICLITAFIDGLFIKR